MDVRNSLTECLMIKEPQKDKGGPCFLEQGKSLSWSDWDPGKAASLVGQPKLYDSLGL